MYTCRMQPERQRLKGVRSAVSRYLDAKALANALAGNALRSHASSKAQLAELWRWQLERALSYTPAWRRGSSGSPSSSGQ